MGIMSSFEKHFGGILTFVLFFVPLVTGMSGNIGIQCSTVLVRSMAVGTLSGANRSQAIMKELCSGLFTGTFFGILCGFIVYFLDLLLGGTLGATPPTISVMVGIGLVGACFTGSFLGVFSPLFFARLGVDPAIASGPIITAFNDFLSMIIYLMIAWSLHSLFF